MVTRQHRLSDFEQGVAPQDQALELLCEDHSGTYVLPYACLWNEGAWHNSETKVTIAAKVLGWRSQGK